MSLDAPKSDAELLAIYEAQQRAKGGVTAIARGPDAVYVAPRPKRASPRTIEHGYQRTLVEWAWGDALLVYPELAELFAVPNGGARSKKTAGMLNGEGVRAGVLDLYLLVPRGGYHGFAHELKAEGRRPTAAQLEEIRALTAAGYDAAWGVGWEHARDRLLRYVALPPPSRR